MENSIYKNLTMRSIKAALVLAVVLACIVFSVGSLIPSKYRSNVSILVIQQSDNKIDAFSAARSAEYLSEILVKVIYTDSFINDTLDQKNVQEENYLLSKVENRLPNESGKRKKAWEGMIEATKVNNTGIIEIDTYLETASEAGALNNAIASNLVQNGKDYHGGGDSIKLKVVDGPNVSSTAKYPNIWLYSVAAFIFGFVSSLVLSYFFPKYEDVYFRSKHGMRKNTYGVEMGNNTDGYFNMVNQDQNTIAQNDILNPSDLSYQKNMTEAGIYEKQNLNNQNNHGKQSFEKKKDDNYSELFGAI